MQIERLAAFATAGLGGNPAGVVIGDVFPDATVLQRVAREVGYSETVFAAPEGPGWKGRLCAPEAEVAFCGHATIALGCVLGRRFGAGRYDLALSQASISVVAERAVDAWRARLTSPPTWSRPLPAPVRGALLRLFGQSAGDLDPVLPPQLAHGGATHGILALRDRKQLAAMAYPFDAMRRLMQREGLTTVSLLHVAASDLFISRNAFAIGGVAEDPATGAAAAALGGVLADIDWPLPAGRFTIRQGEDMAVPSLIGVQISGVKGAGVRVSGSARWL